MVKLDRLNKFTSLAVVLLAGFTAQPQIHAQEMSDRAAAESEGIACLHTTSWGMAYGQTTRISMENPASSERDGRPLFVQVTLFDATGESIAVSDEIAIPAGESRSVDFNRDDLYVAGEPGSGRLQTRAQIRYRGFFIVDRTKAILLRSSVEMIDNGTGRTYAVWLTTGFFEVVES
jgi:hypothetical protein